NLGSMLALLAYPTIIEPRFETSMQTWLWAAGYLAMATLIVCCGTALSRTSPSVALSAVALSAPSRSRVIDKQAQVITPWRSLRWVALAAAPSSLMLGVTAYLTADIAAIPLLWVIPLALYLLSFILAFARWPLVWVGRPHVLVLYVQPAVLIFLVFILAGNWR